MNPSNTELHRPFLKWAGAKTQLVSTIKQLLPEAKRFIEPFVGSGAVFINTNYPQNTLADANYDLINMYKHLKKYGQEFIDYAQSFYSPGNNTEEKYYQLRAQFNHTQDLYEKSALFLYLNRHGYNGLCRYNSKGIYNVPFGRYRKPQLQHDALQKFLQKLKKTKLVCQDFTKLAKLVEPGDVVYCDPPYVPLSTTSHFTRYSQQEFAHEQQKQLAQVAIELTEQDCTVLISNHDTDFTREIYQQAKLHHVDVRRFITCKGGSRKHRAQELLALFTP
jgi:DNA adenine methylase